MFSDTGEVFAWMHKKTGDGSFYLNLLNPRYVDKASEDWLPVFIELAHQLKAETDLVRQMLSSHWRPSLVATSVILLLRSRDFEKDVVQRLLKGSWIAPQLAVCIGLISLGQERAVLERHLNQLIVEHQANPDSELGKYLMSTYSALKFMGAQTAQEFENSPYFREVTPMVIDQHNWQNADNFTWLRLIGSLWEFWSAIPPIQF